jgi:Rod binding domain-containing protein
MAYESVGAASLNVTSGDATRGVTLSVEEYRKKELSLEESCKQFEGSMFAKLWKDMLKSARSIGGEERKREYGPLEDTVVEMVSEHLSESQGVGVWKVLYDQLHAQLPVPDEIRREDEATRAKLAEAGKAYSLRPARR